MASRTAADRRPSAPGLPSQWSCSAGKLIPIHLRLPGRPAGVSLGVPAPFPHALRTREFDAPARERKLATPQAELSAFSSTVAERRRESSGWPQRQPGVSPQPGGRARPDAGGDSRLHPGSSPPPPCLCFARWIPDVHVAGTNGRCGRGCSALRPPRPSLFNICDSSLLCTKWLLTWDATFCVGLFHWSGLAPWVYQHIAPQLS